MKIYYYNNYQREINFIEAMQLLTEDELNYIYENKCIGAMELDNGCYIRFEWED